MPANQKLIVEELLTKPSAVSPTLFIGLGGCGCRIVARVANHLMARPDYEDRYKDLVKFALVDTNVNDLEAMREVADETFLVSDFEKEQYANLAAGKLFLEEDSYFTQWVPPDYRFRAGDTAGAGQIRIEARLGVYYQMKHKDLVPRLRHLLEKLKSHEHGHRRLDSAEIRIVVCYSIAGGTGSGSHLPLAYTLRDLAGELGKPWMVGVAVMPAVFEDKTGINKDGTFANGYAALKETEYLMKLGAPDSQFYQVEGIEFHYNPSDESRIKVREKPFDFIYVVDKPESFSVPEPIDAAADGLYLQLFSPLIGCQISDYDNYTQHQRFLVPHDFEAKEIVGFTSFYGSYGAAVLLVPVNGLVKYCSQAAALSLMRASFVRDIPGAPGYTSLRTQREAFDEVTRSDKKGERPIPRAEFVKKEPTLRETLHDRLFMKRIRLLAACERSAGVDDRFSALFRHGHRVGEVPTVDGGFELLKERVKYDREMLSDGRMKYSINALVLPSITPGNGRPAGLLNWARRKIEEFADEEAFAPRSDTTQHDLQFHKATWRDEFKRVGLRAIREGYKEGTLSYPGLSALVELEFLKGEAGEVDLSAKRYAVLRILDEVKWDFTPPEREQPDSQEHRADSKKLSPSDLEALVGRYRGEAIQEAMIEVERAFIERLGDLKDSLDRYAGVQRQLEHGFDDLEREQRRRLARLSDEGEHSANQYVLDAEALSIEDGRRMWDFFYEDRVAGLRELSLGDRRIQQLLSDTVTDLSTAGSQSTTASLQRLFTNLRLHAERLLQVSIGGDPKSAHPEKRDGLTLSDALELEVIYRALYLSDAKRVTQEGHKAIREIMASYRALPPEEQIDLGLPVHRDYLRDKVKRVVKEKASLLCVYEEAKDQHGGVRPDHVLLAAIDENFKNGTIEEALTGADIANLQWVSTGWHNPKEIIFYRAVLNVPLYVFGRLKEMKHYYHEFKQMAKRSKVLHIDRNWEDSLADLDPDSAQENHHRELVRNHIINFAALQSIENRARDDGSSYILRRDGKYYLCDPAAPASNLSDPHNDDTLSFLGETFKEAITRLPAVLRSEAVKYAPYQRMLNPVRQGLSPVVLSDIVQLPFGWRRNRDELRTKYGPSPKPKQLLKLADFTDAYTGLQEALDALLEDLRNKEIEQRTLGEDTSLAHGELTREQARTCLAQSIEYLRVFSETWQRVENPESISELPRGFQELFEPLSEEEFKARIERLRQAFQLSSERLDKVEEEKEVGKQAPKTRQTPKTQGASNRSES